MTDPFPARSRVGVAALAMWAALCGIAWVVIAALVTGRWDAYTATELSWRAQYIGYGELLPGTAWFQAGDWWLGQPWGTIVPVLAMLGGIGLLMLPQAKRLGSDLRWWLGSYGLYLFLVFFPQSSSFRILAPMFPVAGMLAQIRSRVIKVLLVLASIAGQAWWMYIAWAIVGTDWTPP